VAQLEDYREIYRRKGALRRVYHDLLLRIRKELAPGLTVELGCGSGNAKDLLHESVSVDVIPASWVDVAADGQALPFRDGSVANLVLVDVLHHMAQPGRFLHEAERVLVSDGRIVMVEPAITPVSWFFYRFLHHEGVDFSADPLDWGSSERVNGAAHDPFVGNQAVPTLLLRKSGLDAFEHLRVEKTAFMGLFAYPLSGGFQRWSLIPPSLVGPLLKLEEKAMPILGRVMAFRLFAVIRRAPRPEAAT
jgi:SAM-dependent methyltransferase